MYNSISYLKAKPVRPPPSPPTMAGKTPPPILVQDRRNGVRGVTRNCPRDAIFGNGQKSVRHMGLDLNTL